MPKLRARRSRLLLAWVASSIPVLLGIKLCPGPPLAPVAGLPQYQELAALAVPGGLVNVAGGNLIVSRTDLSLDTHLGAFTVGATYNSAAGKWLWSFDDIQYANGSFTDPTGSVHDVSGLPDGQAIPGTAWVKVTSTILKTKGGLEYLFGPSPGRVIFMKWTNSSSYPYLWFRSAILADGKIHTTSIEHCVQGSGCLPIYDFQHDSLGRVTQIVDRAGRIAEFTYDASGRLATARDALDVATGWPGFRYEYQDTRLTALTNSEGERVEFGYDGTTARVLRVRPIGEENPVHSFTYKGKNGGLYSTIYVDPVGDQTTFRYDSTRRIRSVQVVLDAQQALSELTSFEWTDKRITRTTGPDGISHSRTHAGDDLASWTQPSGNVVTFTYQPNGVNRQNPWARPILAVADGVGPIETRTYDAQGRLSTIANGAGEVTSFSYGANQMVSAVTSPAGVVTTLADYGEHGHPRSVTLGDIEGDYVYDEVGNLLQGPSFVGSSAPGLGGILSRAFDPDRNVATVALEDLSGVFALTQTPTQTLTIERRSDGRPTEILRPYGGDTEFLYDALGRLESQREKASGAGHATWQTQSFSYDALGRLTARTRPNGMSESWSHDAAGRVTEHSIHEDSSLESTASFSYAQGRLASVLDSVYGSAETYGYDAAGRVATVTYPQGESLDLIYDARSRLTAGLLFGPANGPLFRILGFGYDAANREATVRDGDLTLLDRTFEAGQLASIVYGNGVERTLTYDPVNGLPAGAEAAAGGTSIESSTIEYDPLGMTQFAITASTQTMGAVAVSTTEYHALGPNQNAQPVTLAGKRAGYWSSLGSSPQSWQYNYDELSNLTGGYVFTYNTEHNRLLEMRGVGGGLLLHDYDYDEAGYVTIRDGVSLDWNGAGRIASIGSSASFVWDTQGRLVSRTLGGSLQRRLFGGLVEADSAGNPTAIDLGEVRIDLTEESHLYRHFDFRGNVKLTTDDDGAVVAHYHYSAYAIEAVHGSPGSAEENRGFAQGREYAGLLLLGPRLYDYDAGRFLAPDPVYQLINQHSYTLGNPVWFWDPGGTQQAAAGRPAVTKQQLVGVLTELSLTTGVGSLLLAEDAPPVAVALGLISLASGLGAYVISGGPGAYQAGTGAGADTGVSQPSGQGESAPGEGQSGHYYEARFDGFVAFAAVSWGSCNAGHSGAGFSSGWGGLAPVGAVMLPDIRPLVFCLLPLAAIVGWRAFRETRRIPAEGSGRAERFHGC